jgi:hypothetical protein
LGEVDSFAGVDLGDLTGGVLNLAGMLKGTARMLVTNSNGLATVEYIPASALGLANFSTSVTHSRIFRWEGSHYGKPFKTTSPVL